MKSMTNQKLVELRESLKNHDGGVMRWIKACQVTPQAFKSYFESKAATKRKLEVYKIGLIVLRELRKEEQEAIELIEAEVMN